MHFLSIADRRKRQQRWGRPRPRSRLWPEHGMASAAFASNSICGASVGLCILKHTNAISLTLCLVLFHSLGASCARVWSPRSGLPVPPAPVAGDGSTSALEDCALPYLQTEVRALPDLITVNEADRQRIAKKLQTFQESYACFSRPVFAFRISLD